MGWSSVQACWCFPSLWGKKVLGVEVRVVEVAEEVVEEES